MAWKAKQGTVVVVAITGLGLVQQRNTTAKNPTEKQLRVLGATEEISYATYLNSSKELKFWKKGSNKSQM